MPRWNKTLSDESMLYLVAFLKTLPADPSTPAGEIEITDQSQVEDPKKMQENYHTIHKLDGQQPYVYGGGRGE
jgi:hypothetical protein